MSIPAPAQTALDDAAEREPSSADTPAAQLPDGNAEADVETVSIELNFNAFADHVPPDRHARRIAKPDDPSIQDFADQVLEVAALRAELKRLTREYETLQKALRVRDMRLQALQAALAAARNGSRDPEVPSDAQSQLETVTIPDVAALQQRSDTAGRRLIPLDHPGEPVPLTRDIITIGRTPDNDICIPSGGVSRDHARLLVAPRSVTIVDMDSANGCFVNDERVSKCRLRDGDVLRLGDRSYRFADAAR